MNCKSKIRKDVKPEKSKTKIDELTELVENFQEPERSIKFNSREELTAFEFKDNMNEVFVGFDDGKVIKII